MRNYLAIGSEIKVRVRPVRCAPPDDRIRQCCSPLSLLPAIAGCCRPDGPRPLNRPRRGPERRDLVSGILRPQPAHSGLGSHWTQDGQQLLESNVMVEKGIKVVFARLSTDEIVEGLYQEYHIVCSLVRIGSASECLLHVLRLPKVCVRYSE